jgi:DEAD/DEAH box helicase domain-containing protein
MTDLINKRNLKFRAAVSDLLIACSSHNPPLDPVELLLEATEEKLPVHPDELLTEDDIRERGVKERKEELEFRERNPDLRPSMRQIIEEMMGDKELYRDQIVEDGHRTTEAREAVYGASPPRVLHLGARSPLRDRRARSCDLSSIRRRPPRNKEH